MTKAENGRPAIIKTNTRNGTDRKSSSPNAMPKILKKTAKTNCTNKIIKQWGNSYDKNEDGYLDKEKNVGERPKKFITTYKQNKEWPELI